MKKILSTFFMLFFIICQAENVLVTGGAGYIGSHVCKALYEAGFTPIVIDNLSNGRKEAVQWGPLIIADLCEKEKIAEVFQTYKPIAVLHFAGSIRVEESVSNPSLYYHNNVVNALYLLDTMRNFQVPYIIFSSTAAIYGLPQTSPISEEHAKNPLNAYGTSKLMIEMILNDYAKAYHIQYVALRYFNASGCDYSSNLGSNYKKVTHLIPSVIKVSGKEKDHLYIFGEDYPTPDGTAIRDYIHVKDLASAHVAALQYLLSGKGSIQVNLGTGRGYSVKEVVMATHECLGLKVPYILSPRRAGDSSNVVANSEKGKKLLNWEPKYSDIKTILQDEWQWYLRQNRQK